MAGTPDLAPVARLAVRLLADGRGLADAERILALEPAAVDRALRAALRAQGLAAPPPSGGRAALLPAAGPLVTAAAATPGTPSTACPPPEVAATAWRGDLDGPLLLATAEHLADCDACRGRAASAPAAESGDPAGTGAAGGRGCLPALALVLAAGGGAAALLLLPPALLRLVR